MANLQRYFETYHDRIRTDYDMSATLREKRDIILDRIATYLASEGLPTFDRFLQGSYRMGTGVVPLSGFDYDIDVGLRFNIADSDYSAATVRDWVFAAVNGHTQRVEDKGPCTRVIYVDGYHVDIVSYACWTDPSGQSVTRLAHKEHGWRPADPAGLLDYVRQVRLPFKDTEDTTTQTDQFRRVVRYLRRWMDLILPGESPDKLTGLGCVLLSALHLPSPRFSLRGESDDLRALQQVAAGAGYAVGRIVLRKPTPEYEDMAGRLSDVAMNDLKARLLALHVALEAAATMVDPADACESLRPFLGTDFPVPSRQETARLASAPAIITSSSSA
jgi:hypothetical protein